MARVLPGPAGLSSPRGRARAAALAAVALVLAAAVAALSGGARGPARVAVEQSAPGRTVPPSFLGLSMEWTSVEPFGGPARAGVVALLDRVRAAAGTPLGLRIGGASAEESWWNPEGRPRPATVRHDIGPATLDALARLARGLGAPVTVGLNLSLGDPANALALARAARRRLGSRLDALEVGNEPDLYTTPRTIGPVAVRRLRKRARYTPADYVRDAGRFLDVLAPALGARPRLAVGGFAGRRDWAADTLPPLIDGRRGRIGVVSAHLYALARCYLDPGDPGALRRRLLSEAVARGRAAALRSVIALAHRRGLPLRVAELNSAPCGGAPGVSDSFAAALWLTDALFALLREGADAVDVQTWDGAVYAPFARAGGAVRARPPLYGMLAFARAAPRGSRLVPVGLRDAGAVRAWATVDARGTVRVALLAATDAARARVRLAVAAGRPCATVRVTSAPSLAARTGIVERAARRCPRRGALALRLPGPSLEVVELPARGARARAPSSAGSPSSSP